MKQRVFFIVPTLDSGGTENYVLRFVREYHAQFEFHVLSIKPIWGDLHNQYSAAGVIIYYLSIGYINPLKWIALYNILRRNKIESLCSFNGNFGGIPTMIAYAAGIKKRIVFYRRSTPAFKVNLLSKIYFWLVGRMVLLFATDILSNSNSALKNFFPHEYTRRRFHIIPNGVDPKLVESGLSKEICKGNLGIPKDCFVIGHLGRVDKAKNHSAIFNVARTLIEKNMNVYFVFCGLGTGEEDFKRKLRQFEIENYCLGLGVRDKVGDILNAFDIFLFPSVTEGQPNALIEAMLAGLPVLASDIEPIRETVPTEFHRLLIPAHDVNAFVMTIIRMINSEVAREKYKLKSYAQEYFEPKKRFEEFKKFLTFNA